MKPAPSYEKSDIKKQNVDYVTRLVLALWLHIMIFTVYECTCASVCTVVSTSILDSYNVLLR